MRTTLTLDDDLAVRLQRLARTSERSFKELVNDLLRRGLAAGERPHRRGDRFVVQPKACGFRPGVDLLKLNQLADELATTEQFGSTNRRR